MDKSKQFELMLLKKHVNTKAIQEANAIVEQFIHKKKLIIYGGTAIDFSCRLKGEKIYPDDILPFTDYDFFSPRSVQDAYTLAMILYQADFPDVSAFMAQHGRTMRVAMGGHIVADISWVPEKFFRKIPTKLFPATSNPELELRFTSPEFQITDMHLSLAFPFSNPPLEVVNGRALKDVKRFNLLYNLWVKEIPIRMNLSDYIKTFQPKTYNVEARCEAEDPVWTGFVSLALHQKGKKCSLPVEYDGKKMTIMLPDLDVPIEYITTGLVPTHNRLLDYYFESKRGQSIAFLPSDTLVPIMQTDGHKHCTLQYVLAHFALRANIKRKSSMLYWAYYFAALELLDPTTVFGTEIWPSIDAPNINDTSQLWREMTLANVDDIRENRNYSDPKSAVAAVNMNRPRKMIPEITDDSRIGEFMSWDYRGPIFAADGKKIK